MRRMAAGRTVLIIAHRLATIADVDVINVIDEGRIVQSGTHAQLLQKEGRYAEFWARSRHPAEERIGGML